MVSSGGNRPLIIACDERAQEAGIRNGMALSAAYALSSEITVRTRDSGAEQRCLEEIALWALQFTSQISVLSPASLLLEIGGSLRLFGGLDALRNRISDSAEQLGFDTLTAVAPAPRGAYWLAHAGLAASAEDQATLRHHLNRLPVACIDADADTFRSLERRGIRTIGELARLPRDALARRFGQTRVQLVSG